MTQFNEERVERQLDIDAMIRIRGESNYDKGSLRLARDNGFGDTAAGKRFTSQAVKGFVEKFHEYVEKQLSQPATRSVLVKNLVSDNPFDEETEYVIDPVQLGRIVVRSLLRSLVKPEDKRITVTGVAFDIGESVEFAIKETLLDMHHKRAKHQMMDMLRRQQKAGDREEIKRMIEKLSVRVNLNHDDWDKKTQGAVGESLLMLFYKSKVYREGCDNLLFSDLFVEHDETDYKSGKINTRKTLDISPIGVEWLKENEDFIRSLTMSFLPMVIQPQDWSIDHGGYRDQAIYDTYTLIKGYSRRKIRKLYDLYPEGFDKLMETINILQKTPFRINQTVWNAVSWVHKNEFNLDRKGIPNYIGGWAKILGEEKAEEFFMVKRNLIRNDKVLTPESRKLLLDFVKSVIEGSEKMSEKDIWKEWGNLRKAVVKHSRAESSKRILVENTLTDSEEFLGEDIYFCYNADYRGRIYPLSGQFSPQGSDISRGMLEFANGVEVDPETDLDAIRQIAIVIANNFGEDKISLDDRELWSIFHTEQILECADDFEHNQWWTTADKPFLFLLSCLEWKKYIDAKESGTTFVSTMPIAFDGSCNGIQHYSAMFLDPKGAKAVNLVDGEVPSDVYQEVADQALIIAQRSNARYEKLAVKLNEELDGKLFGRKVAKRSVMTLPYGVSKRSSNLYVYDEVENLIRKLPLTGNERKGLKGKMGSLIWEAILLVVEKPVTGKEYFQSVANEMAEWNRGLMWFTPTGLPIKQNLKKKDVKPNTIRVTIEGETVVRKYPRYISEIDGKEQANAVAPNFVHSYDSCHLQLSIIAAHSEGMENFLVIHDSFSTDAIHAGRFNHVIREQFVNMYSKADWINKFHNDCQDQLGIELSTNRQELGDFDVTDVLDSKYFFS